MAESSDTDHDVATELLLDSKAEKNGGEGEEDLASELSEDETVHLSIHQAAREGAIKKIKEDVEAKGIDLLKIIDQPNSDNQSPIHLAARYNREHAIKFLCAEGAWIDKPGEDQNTALLIAVKYDCTEAARALIDNGADCKIKNSYGQTALHFSSRRGNFPISQLLLSFPKIDFDAADNSSVTPIHMAVSGGNPDVVKLLLDAGANCNVVDSEGILPIHLAAKEGQTELLPILIISMQKTRQGKKGEVDPVNITTNEKKTPLQLAAQSGHRACVQVLLIQGADVNSRSLTKSTALHYAATFGDTSVLKQLVLNHAKVNAKDEKQMTSMHIAALFGRTEAIKFLRSRGASLNATDQDNSTPLHCAVLKGQTDAAQLIISMGANYLLKDAFMRNVLHVAVQENHTETLKMLLNNGCSNLVNHVDKDYRTPLHYAAAVGNVKTIGILLDYHARVDKRDNQEKIPLHLAAHSGKTKAVTLLGELSTGTLNLTDDRGRSAVHIAALNGLSQVCEKLISLGADIAVKDDVQWTPLDYVAAKGYSKVMKLFLSNHSPVETCNKNSETALHHAAKNGHVECVNMLLNYGAKITAVEQNGKNCLDLAIEHYQKDVCMALIKHKRWKDIMRSTDNKGIRPMEKLIEVVPEVAEVVLNNCIEYSKHTKENKDYSITYNFEYLDIHPDKQRKNDMFFGPAHMAKFNRESLLSHPVTINLINDKWARLGRQAFFIMLLFYLLYVASLTWLIIRERERENRDCEQWLPKILTLVCGSLALIQILKEILQFCMVGCQYFLDPTNYIEILLHGSSSFFLVIFTYEHWTCDSLPFMQDKKLKWHAAAVAIFLGWMNLLLSLRTFPLFGLTVVMFVEVLRTVISVMSVFSIFLIAFSLCFHVLMTEEAKASTFSPLPKSFIKTFSMMTGEFNFDTVMGDLKHFAILTRIMFILFVLFLPIVMINLMVGLAVGEIAEVKKSAKLILLKDQVDIIMDLDRRFPKRLKRKSFRNKIVLMPNQRPVFRRFVDWLMTHNFEEDKTRGNETKKEKSHVTFVTSFEKQLDQQEKRMKKLNRINEDQSELIRKILLNSNNKEQLQDDRLSLYVKDSGGGRGSLDVPSPEYEEYNALRRRGSSANNGGRLSIQLRSPVLEESIL